MFNALGDRLMRWLERSAVRRALARMNVGRRVSVKSGLRVHKPRNITLGDDVRINTDVTIQAHGPVTIGDRTMVAAGCIIVTANHDLSKRGLEAFGNLEAGPVSIGSDCWLGAGAVVLPGVTIGDGAVVAAGSVVTRDLPAETICIGAPARPVRPRPGADS